MQYSASTEGFRLAYERSGSGVPVVLLHGWPGDIPIGTNSFPTSSLEPM
jgi:pimeloyl-ACP methyl ester carboxylesterase